MPVKKSKKENSRGHRTVFEFKQDTRHEIAPFLNTFRSYLYESRVDKNRNKIQNLENELTIMREIMSMKMKITCAKYFDVQAVTNSIKELAGKNKEDDSVVCPETQMENCCKFISEQTGKEVVGFYFHEPFQKPKYVTNAFIGEFNLILIKMKSGRFATANCHNLFPKDGRMYCISCRKPYEQSSKHTSQCKMRCSHCFGMGNTFPCEQELPDGQWLKCEGCRFEFKSQKCYDQHLKTACHKKVKCEKCKKPASTRGSHVCGSSHCFKCNKTHPENDPQKGLNYCYIQKQRLVLATDFQRVLYVFYDIETRPEYVSELPKKRNIIPDPYDSDLEGEDLEEMDDDVHFYISKTGSHNDDILPEPELPPFPERQYSEEELGESGIIDMENFSEEEANNFNDDCNAYLNMKSNWQQIANLVCAKVRCSDCIDITSDDYKCAYCEHTTKAWTSVPNMEGAEEVEKPCDGFRDYLIQKSQNEDTSRIYCFGHNAGRFDTHLCAKSFVDEGYNTQSLTMQGNTIIQTTFYEGETEQKIIFRDSYRLLPIALKAFQKTFDLDPSVAKFDFPHYFNREEFYDVELDTLPGLEFYGYSYMKKDDKKAFLEKYERECKEMEEKGEKYRLPEQLLKYCLQDVECLYRGILSHRTQMKGITQSKIDEIDFEKRASSLGKNSDPKYYDLLLRGSTVASLALYIYRLKYLKAETVALVPESGYQSTVNQSQIAIAYMDFIVKESKGTILIRHRDNMGEYKIGNMYVDGYDMLSGNIYQVMGCQFHGCVRCRHGDRSVIQWNGKSANELYAETVAKQKKLRAEMDKLSAFRNAEIIEIWECDIAEERKRNPILDAYIKDHEDTSPINLRATLTGGRTGPMVLEAEADYDTEIKYFDICSLYPYINFTTRYPIKHPEILFEVPAYQHPDELPEFAIIKCKILPPQNMVLPIIPMKFDSQLLFPLCGKCPKERSGVCKVTGVNLNEIEKSCSHSDWDRGFVTSATSMEIRYAMINGYKIVHVYHVLRWSEGSDSLFKDYVREFLKMKVEASEPPPGYETDPEVRKKFQDLYMEFYGIEIGDCVFNAGRRFISKLFLNSLWGKFSMGVYEERMVVDNNELNKYLSDPLNYDLTYHCITDTQIMVRYKRNDNYTVAPNVNLVLSLWTTAAAKLHLYRFMKAIQLHDGSQCLYCDTDSIIFSHKKGSLPLIPGQLLGEMTDEFIGKTITHYRSGGAKQYFLKYKDDKTGEEGKCCKARGFTANAETEKKLTYEAMEYNTKNSVTLKNNTMGPHHDFGIYSKRSTKVYSVTCKKGVITPVDKIKHVFPYGWRFNLKSYMPPWHPDFDNYNVKKD